jgi:cell division protein FtsL
MRPLTAPALSRSTRPAPRPAPAASRPAPRLHVVDEAPRRRVRGTRLVVAAIVAVAVVLLFALAAFHAMLVAGQVNLDELRPTVAEEQARYESLRLEVARLEAPDRIVAVAQERLGMVPPEDITWLPTPAGSLPPPSTGEGAGTEVREIRWGAVKPHLGGSR